MFQRSKCLSSNVPSVCVPFHFCSNFSFGTQKTKNNVQTKLTSLSSPSNPCLRLFCCGPVPSSLLFWSDSCSFLFCCRTLLLPSFHFFWSRPLFLHVSFCRTLLSRFLSSRPFPKIFDPDPCFCIFWLSHPPPSYCKILVPTHVFASLSFVLAFFAVPPMTTLFNLDQLPDIKTGGSGAKARQPHAGASLAGEKHVWFYLSAAKTCLALPTSLLVHFTPGVRRAKVGEEVPAVAGGAGIPWD